MIFIDKKNTPTVFTETKRKCPSYDMLHREDKNLLKEVLIKEQGGICAYCMSRIDMDTSTIEHYIPQHGSNGDISLSMDYQNMFAVCKRTRFQKEKDKTCDDKKKENLITIDPRRRSDIDQIKYSMNGRIYSERGDFNSDLNNTLNLNQATLINNRKAAIEAVLYELTSQKSGKWNSKILQKRIEKYNNDYPKREYYGAIIYFLNKRLKREST